MPQLASKGARALATLVRRHYFPWSICREKKFTHFFFVKPSLKKCNNNNKKTNWKRENRGNGNFTSIWRENRGIGSCFFPNRFFAAAVGSIDQKQPCLEQGHITWTNIIDVNLLENFRVYKVRNVWFFKIIMS